MSPGNLSPLTFKTASLWATRGVCCVFSTKVSQGEASNLLAERFLKALRALLQNGIFPQAQYGHHFELKLVRKSHLMLILAFLLPHPLATKIFQREEERVINATQWLHPFSAVSQESPGMLWAPVLDGCITYIHAVLCSVHVQAVRSSPPVSLADNHIVPFLCHLKIISFKIIKWVSKILAAEYSEQLLQWNPQVLNKHWNATVLLTLCRALRFPRSQVMV